MWTRALIVTALLAPPAVALADPSARALAARGLELVDKGNDVEGCKLLADAWRMDDSLLGTGFALAGCHERRAELASALALYRRVAFAARARRESRAAEAVARMEELNRHVSRIEVRLSAADELAAPAVSVDGADIGQDRTKPVDGGEHTVKVFVRGTSRSKTVRVAPRDARVIVSFVDDDPGGIAPSWARPVGVGLGLAGLGAIGASIGLAVFAKGQHDDAVQKCGGVTCNRGSQPDEAARQAEAFDLANAATGLVVAGAVFAGAGLVLAVLPPRRERPSAAVSLGFSGLTLRLEH